MPDKFRNYATSSFSHNVIVIDGQGQAPGSMLVKQSLSNKYFKISDKFDYAWNSFDRFRELKRREVHKGLVLCTWKILGGRGSYLD
ncbi:MAG: hypothetical protein ABIQ00_21580 [Chitinophagaceae bacterium]